MWQQGVVAIVVLCCSVYAGWSLMPATWRRGLALRLLRWPALGAMAPLQRAAGGASGGCGGCSSCDGPPKTAAGAVPIRITRRPPGR